jgi:large subunit ribosomal protein L19e
MKLTLQKRLASAVSGSSPKKVVFDASKLAEIKEAITKQDIRTLINEGTIQITPKKGVSRVRANHIRIQKARGMRKGKGSRKGRHSARQPQKREWINRVRSQRKFLKRIVERGVVTHDVYKDLYAKTGGGFFRSIKHIQIFMDEKSLVTKKEAAAGAPATSAVPHKKQ